MDIKILCTECNKHYFCVRENTKMRGPIIETICPHCRQKVVRNMGAFLERQTVHIGDQLGQAGTMLALSKAMEKLIGNEEAYKKKKK
jgi:hypothetical protein